MADESETPPPPSTAVHPPTINHLLILTLTTGFVFAYFSPHIADAVKIPSERYAGPTAWKETIKFWTIGITVLACLVFGVRFFGFAAVARELVVRKSLQWLSLGHWYFLLSGPQFFLSMCTETAGQYMLGREHASFWQLWFQGIDAAASLVFSVILLCVAIRLQGWSWRVAAIILAFVELDLALFRARRIAQAAEMIGYVHPMHFLGSTGTLFISLILVVGMIYLVSSRYRLPKKDWLHHLGMAVMLFDAFDFLQAFHRVILQWWSGTFTYLGFWFTSF